MKTRTSDGGECANRNSRLLPAAPKTFSRSFVVAAGLLAMSMLVPPAKAVPVQLLSARNPSVPLPGLLVLDKSLPIREIRTKIFHNIFERIALVPANYLVTGY